MVGKPAGCLRTKQERGKKSLAPTGGTAVCKISLLDVFGREVLSQQLTLNPEPIKTLNLSTGIYFLQVTTNTGRTVQKVVKQ